MNESYKVYLKRPAKERVVMNFFLKKKLSKINKFRVII